MCGHCLNKYVLLFFGQYFLLLEVGFFKFAEHGILLHNKLFLSVFTLIYLIRDITK